MEIKDIYYIAGLLDGEGCFGGRAVNLARITLSMTDYDTVLRAKDIIGAKVSISTVKVPGKKDRYTFQINGHLAIGWMMIMYSHPYISARRKERIKQILSNWRNARTYNGFTTATGQTLVAMIARKHGISMYEARRIRSGFATDSTGRTYIGMMPPRAASNIIGEFRRIINPFERMIESRS